MKSNSILAAAVIAFGLVLAAAVFAIVQDLLRATDLSAGAGAIARLERAAADQQEEIRSLRSEVSALRERLRAIEAGQPPGAEGGGFVPAEPQPPEAAEPEPWPRLPDLGPGSGGIDQFGGLAPGTEEGEEDGLVDAMRLAKHRFNRSVARPRPQVLREILGEPREAYSQDCQPVTNPRMVALLETRQIARFKLTMIRPALDSLETVMERLAREEPAIYEAIGTAGALCARYVRGSSRTVSSHAWGAAVDLTLQKNLDAMGDGTTQFGLVVLAEFFNDAGWYWGAGYGREDSMHFEVGEELLREWVRQGQI